MMRLIARLDDARLNCGNGEWPGVDEVDGWQDFSGRGTTPDQRRIESVMWDERIGLGGALLHVGVGNSELARRFKDRFAYIAGITIQSGELTKAKLDKPPNYDPRLLNKFSAGLAGSFETGFDVIVDNNPTSFACCRQHFSTMMQNYLELLKPGGLVLSDRSGLAFWCSLNSSLWGVTIDEWLELGGQFGFESRSYTKDVVGLMRPAEAVPPGN